MSILIKNGTVYDGSGQAPYKKDILIRGNIISKIGDIPEKRRGSMKIIDAEDAYVMPGFIDTNSDSDHHLNIFLDPHQKKFIKQGITTIIGGNEGISLAPLYNDESLQFIEEKAIKHIPMINFNWEEFDKFLNVIKTQGIGINFGSMVGYSTVRKSIIKDNKSKISERDKKSIQKILIKSLKKGALGISTGFEDSYSNNIKISEINEVLSSLKSLDFIYTSALKNPESNPKKAVKELIKISKKNDISTHISHIQPIKSLSDEYSEIQDLLEKESEKVGISFDCHPYLVRKIPVYKFLPESIKNKQSIDDITEYIKDEENREEILEHLKTKTRKKIKIIHTPRNLNFLEGKYIKEIAKKREENQSETLLNLMQESSMKITCLYEDINKKSLELLMKSDISSIISDGLHLDSNDMNPFTEFLNIVINSKIMPLETAVSKITKIPAQKYKINNRGEIKEGNYADVVVFKENEISDVIVNGSFTLKNKEYQENLSGSVIKSSND